MTTIATIQREQAAIRQWQAAVVEAVLPFESRWTWAALKRIDAGIYRRLMDQRGFFDRALVTGTPEEIARYLRVFGGEGRIEQEVVI